MVVSVVSAPEGIREILAKHKDVEIITAVIDENSTQMNYIIPGLGDAGDRCFGEPDKNKILFLFTFKINDCEYSIAIQSPHSTKLGKANNECSFDNITTQLSISLHAANAVPLLLLGHRLTEHYPLHNCIKVNLYRVLSIFKLIFMIFRLVWQLSLFLIKTNCTSLYASAPKNESSSFDTCNKIDFFVFVPFINYIYSVL